MAIAVVGVDLAKNVFRLHAVDQRGAVVFRCARKRHDWVDAVLERVDAEAIAEAATRPRMQLLRMLDERDDLPPITIRPHPVEDYAE